MNDAKLSLLMSTCTYVLTKAASIINIIASIKPDFSLSYQSCTLPKKI